MIRNRASGRRRQSSLAELHITPLSGDLSGLRPRLRLVLDLRLGHLMCLRITFDFEHRAKRQTSRSKAKCRAY